MVVLDSSTIIQYLRGDDRVQRYIEGRDPWLTSVICVAEVIDGRLGRGGTDVIGVRREFDDVRALTLNETITLEATRMQDRLVSAGTRLATVDLLVAATARSTVDELVVADGDFDTQPLTEAVRVTDLAHSTGSSSAS